ncbi:MULTISPECIES: hypothetical protein [Stenotrophomonas]|jgi:hypothetical protein|uniref:hypothetical protein n=1 Tax=Stenotrophomonas TaxID=40323 RepID=UPI00066EB54C|nr:MULTISPECIES: hypothetical protein [Stenotrophomonas]MBA0354833.1 hypothetical protein [Stenotrophomonas maltophilia]MBH1694841.1 hypothetical protein [Stenotrophomonas maltophilia]MDH0551733.1 hypothetical protein [Stenotrophomonas sp. GD04006]PJL53669.1 hypothetical protein B9Y74_04680 [Stenotrophomonas maltophilia]HEL3174765.1 hypothetical protein [Stenotrophomonas maltophilia]
MNTTMADGASERLDAQIADALFGQPGMSKMDVANRLRQLRGDGDALLGSAAYPAAWMWPHPEDGSVRFTADGDVATEAASTGRAVSALYRVPVQEDAQPSPVDHGDALDLDRVLSLADVHAEESREDGTRLLDRGGLLAFAQDVAAPLAAYQSAHGEPNTARNRLTAGVAGSVTRPWEFRDAPLWAQDAADCSSHPDHKAYRFAFTELLGMIDIRAVA